MGGALTVRLRAKGKSRPQTESSGGESRSGKHNPKVVGSNPTPAIKIKPPRLNWSWRLYFCATLSKSDSDVYFYFVGFLFSFSFTVLISTNCLTKLLMVDTSVKGILALRSNDDNGTK